MRDRGEGEKTSLAFPTFFSEGTKRALAYHRVAELTSGNPARLFGLRGELVWDGGRIVGPARGRFLKRPSPAP